MQKSEELKTQYIPFRNEYFIPFGDYQKVLTIVKSMAFFPIWITGEAGCGKTTSVEQACANTAREYIRINCSAETDESDLIGSYELIDGQTVFKKGPVLVAMERGAVLLLDEVEACRPETLFCMQSVLEGGRVFVKPLNQYVSPAHGFTVFATGNTRGRGSESGRYSGLKIMNTAFLDRFNGMIHQDYPPREIEEKILKAHYVTSVWKNLSSVDEVSNADKELCNKYIDALLKFSNDTRETFKKGGSEETMSTRSLVHVIKTFGVFKDPVESVKFVFERYEPSVSEAFLSLFMSYWDTESVKQAEPENDDEFIQITPD